MQPYKIFKKIGRLIDKLDEITVMRLVKMQPCLLKKSPRITITPPRISAMSRENCIDDWLSFYGP